MVNEQTPQRHCGSSIARQAHLIPLSPHLCNCKQSSGLRIRITLTTASACRRPVVTSREPRLARNKQPPARHDAREERLHAGPRRAAPFRLPLAGGLLPGRALRRVAGVGRLPRAAHLLPPGRARVRVRPRALAQPRRRRRHAPHVLRGQPRVSGRRPRGRPRPPPPSPPAVRQGRATGAAGAARDHPVVQGPACVHRRRRGGRRRRRRRVRGGAGAALRPVQLCRRRLLAGAPAVPGQGPRHRPPRLGPPQRRRRRRVRRQRRQRERRRRREFGDVGERRGPLRHRDALQEDDRGGPLQRPLSQELRTVPVPGERGLQEGRRVLLPRDPRRPRRRRAPVGVRQAGLGGAPRRGPRLQLLRAGGQGVPAEQPRARRARRVPVGHGRRGGRRRRAQLRGLRSAGALVSGFGDGNNLNSLAISRVSRAVPPQSKWSVTVASARLCL
uniref:Uncharacterized protein n=1 Tax=Zea mays TaxID=4577 RepID=A0A804LDE3_MAIZE